MELAAFVPLSPVAFGRLFSSATLDMVDPFLMPTIAAVLIGGCNVVTGGRGSRLYFAGPIFP